MKGGPMYRVASCRRRNEMTSRDWQLTHQRLPCRAGIAAVPKPNPAGPRRQDYEPMMKLRRRIPIVCDRVHVDRNGAMTTCTSPHYFAEILYIIRNVHILSTCLLLIVF